ncbi:hypothetical protein GF314_13335, partial [bacterium]|nr:hypothetical protein [bacterium]
MLRLDRSRTFHGGSRVTTPHLTAIGRRLVALVSLLIAVSSFQMVPAQELSPEMLREAARRSGLSEEEILRRYQEQRRDGAGADTLRSPGRTDLEGIDDRMAGRPDSVAVPAGRGESAYWAHRPDVVLPMSDTALEASLGDSLLATMADSIAAAPELYGRSFFRLPAGVFQPPSFGPVPSDYLIGVGDEIVVDAWGEVEFRVERVVDRDGAIILPRGGEVVCQNRTLADVEEAIRGRLSRSYAGIKDGSIEIDVSLGRLRAIRVFVIGEVVQPGAYEMSSVATVLTALYAAGGPGEQGSLRRVRVERGGETIGILDLYRYLLEGKRDGDVVLREGDTVLVPPRGRTVLLTGEVRRPAFYELLSGETLDDLIEFAGGFTAAAAIEVVGVERIVPPAERGPDQADRTFADIELDPATGEVLDPEAGRLLDGDVVTVDAIGETLWGWVEITGHVKRPGLYEYADGMTVRELVARAGGPWPDTLMDLAVIDRTDAMQRLSTLSIPLGAILDGTRPDVALQERDVLQLFDAGAMIEKETVRISGEVREPGVFTFRSGMTLRDLIARAGGATATADLAHIEVQRLEEENVLSAAAEPPSGSMVRTITIDVTTEGLAGRTTIVLEPWDHVVLRRLPWYERQRLVEIRG